MTIHIRYDEVLEEKVRLDISAGNEACYALHCLSFAEHHELQRNWIDAIRRELPADLHDDIVSFGHGPSDRWLGPTYLIGCDCFVPFEQAIARARALPPDELWRRISEEQGASEGLVPTEIHLRDAVAEDPEAWRDRACGLLDAFWTLFIPFWRELEPVFAQKLGHIERLRQQGKALSELLPDLAPSIAYDPISKVITIASLLEAHVDPLQIESFRLTPTFFGIPHMWMDLTRHAGIDVWVPGAMGPPKEPASVELARSLKALSDPKRLKILSQVLASPRSARELAETLNLSPSAIERHLKTLTGAGMVRQLGSGNTGPYARYEANPGGTARIVDELAHFLERSSAGTVSISDRPAGCSHL